MTPFISTRRMICLLLPLSFFFILCGEDRASDSPLPAKSIRIVLPENQGDSLQNIVAVFTRCVEERSGAKIISKGKGELTIELLVKPGIGKEGFRIDEGKDGAIRITGNDQRGVLYGIGKLLHVSGYGKDGFTPGKWRGVSVPEKPVRGIYFATHFYNYYQTAPVEEIERYIEDLALWGVNGLLVCYDMHHFNGPEDPDAIALHDRLKRFMKAGKKVNMSVGFIVIGNEGYANSPVELRAVPGGSRGGNYPEVICPNKAGGMEYILKILGDHFDWSRDVEPDYLCIWPYDQGGCASADCQPWGSNGFIKCAKAVSSLAKEKIPSAKIILSTWYFDAGEWRSVSQLLEKDRNWVDLILAEGEDFADGKLQPISDKLPTIGFPEISMYGTFPWGGFGATPLPNRFIAQWEKVKGKLSGGFPYSEGIYEDISKVSYAQMYWNSNVNNQDVLKEYISYEYSPAAVNDILYVIKTLEQNHHFRWWPGELEGVKLTLDWFPSKNAKPQQDPGAEEAYAAVKRVDGYLSETAKQSWRWRLLYIRTMLDAELKANGGVPNERCKQGFVELTKIYHSSEKTDHGLKPPM